LKTEGIDITPDGSEFKVIIKENTISVISTTTYKITNANYWKRGPLKTEVFN
jgi:hypothetical protein